MRVAGMKYGWLLLFVGALSGCGAKQNPLSVQPDRPDVVTRGQQIYADSCASCHGKSLQGQFNWRRRLANDRMPAPPHDASGHTWHHSDAYLFAVTKYGSEALAKGRSGPDYRSDMPPFSTALKDEDIYAVLSYIKSKWPPKVRDFHDQVNQRSAR